MNLPSLRSLVTPDLSTTQAVATEDLAGLMERLGKSNVQTPRHSCPRFSDQLGAVSSARPDVLICSLLDGDPDLPLNAVLSLHEADKIAEAVARLGRLAQIERRWLIFDAALPDAWTSQLRRRARELGIRCIFIRNDYPQSDATLLLYTLLGRRLRPGELPTQHGVLLLDGVTAWRLSDPLGAHGTPLAVRDLVLNTSDYVICPVGWRLSDLLCKLEIAFEDRLIRVSDPLRDMRVDSQLKIDGSEIALHLMRPERPINPDPCVRCGWCVEGCPVRIQPAGLLEAAQRGDRDMAERFGLHACIECGICSYVCPSRLPLLTSIRSLRS